MLKEFYGTRDEETRELIIATAVILRQFKEIDDEEEVEEGEDGNNAKVPYERVNFLAILNSILKSSNTGHLLSQRPLLNAFY